jgi:RNA polymerase sigma-70 factor (ECF subfamily)
MIATGTGILRRAPVEGGDVIELAPTFASFYAANARRLYTAFCLITGDPFEAEEVTQEAFVRVCERWNRVGRLDDPSGYVFSVAMNVFRDRYRRARLAVRRAFSLAPRAADEFADVETHDAVVRMIRGLDPKQRAAVVLTAILDYSAEEAGQILGIGASSVRSLTTRARAQMKHDVEASS